MLSYLLQKLFRRVIARLSPIRGRNDWRWYEPRPASPHVSDTRGELTKSGTFFCRNRRRGQSDVAPHTPLPLISCNWVKRKEIEIMIGARWRRVVIVRGLPWSYTSVTNWIIGPAQEEMFVSKCGLLAQRGRFIQNCSIHQIQFVWDRDTKFSQTQCEN